MKVFLYFQMRPSGYLPLSSKCGIPHAFQIFVFSFMFYPLARAFNLKVLRITPKSLYPIMQFTQLTSHIPTMLHFSVETDVKLQPSIILLPKPIFPPKFSNFVKKSHLLCHLISNSLLFLTTLSLVPTSTGC